MTFHPTIPQPGDDPSNSQADLLDNFGKMNSDFAVNHVALTAGGNNGSHTLVQFFSTQVADPVLTGKQSALYPKLVAGLAQLFFANASTVAQITNPPIINTGTNYSMVTPWGLVMNFGTATTTPIVFKTPFTSLVYFSQINTIATVITDYAVFSSYTTAGPNITGMNYLKQGNPTVNYVAWGI